MIDKRIVDFLKEHHVVALSTFEGGELWSWHSFYLYLEEENLLITASSSKSKHIGMVNRLRKNGTVNRLRENGTVNPPSEGGGAPLSGAIARESEAISTLRGLQFKGVISPAEGGQFGKYGRAYLKRFPYAILKWADLWIIELKEMKLTDNRLGFGTKVHWPFL